MTMKKLGYVALTGAFCLAVVGTATTLSDKSVTTLSNKETVTLSQRIKKPKGSHLGKSDSF